MTPKRAAAYIGGALLLAAWLASAAGTVWQHEEIQEAPRPVPTAGTETLAADVQAQAVRLREHMAAAPAPQSPSRNPFAFVARAPVSSPRPAIRADVADAPVTPLFPADPFLALIGIAEDESPAGVVRTAIITAEGDELFLVKVGEPIAGRYAVAAIGSDVVELTDLANGVVRRLALR